MGEYAFDLDHEVEYTNTKGVAARGHLVGVRRGLGTIYDMETGMSYLTLQFLIQPKRGQRFWTKPFKDEKRPVDD